MSFTIPRAICFTARQASRPRRKGFRVYCATAKLPMDKPGGKVTKKEDLLECKKAVEKMILDSKCNPILVRLAWHDSGTYDKSKTEFPSRGGANGSIRFYPEVNHNANAGLTDAMELLKDLADSYDSVGYADLFQLASATGIQLAGGPEIKLRFGRRDAENPEGCAPEGNLPAGGGPYPGGAKGPGDHLRNVFYRMGFTDQEIVALSGAHTLGRAKPDRSGFGKEKTKYTENGPGNPGGSSWTPEWLKFDNSYFKEVKDQHDPELLVLETDNVLFKDEGFRPYAMKYAEDQDAFFKDYAAAHLKLSELEQTTLAE